LVFDKIEIWGHQADFFKTEIVFHFLGYDCESIIIVETNNDSEVNDFLNSFLLFFDKYVLLKLKAEF
jgi:hypothetical protein